MAVSNITGPALFRTIEQWKPTLIIDEADTFFADKDELRGVLNAGHRRNTAYVARVVGEDHEVKLFPTWAPKAIAAIGKMAETLEDRAIVIPMKRRAPGETVERFRITECEAIAKPIRQRAARWAQDNVEALRQLRPTTLPNNLNDRAQDNWTPLFAIAELAGPEWMKRVRAAALALCGEVDESDNSALVDLLREFHEIFDVQDKIGSADLVKHLTDDPNGRWIEWRRGNPITQRQVANLVAPLRIRPHKIRVGDKTLNGYDKTQFTDAFSRYPVQDSPSDPEQAEQDKDSEDLDKKNNPEQDSRVPDQKSGLSTLNLKNVPDVPDKKGVSGGNGQDAQGFDWANGEQKGETDDEYWVRIKAEHVAKRAAGVRN